MDSMRLTIVIPAHNEEASLPVTITSLEVIVTVSHEVIVVNDHSSDNTAKVVMELSDKFNNIRLVDNDTEPGFTNAIKKGFSEVKGEMVVLVMADSCDEPDTINRMYNKICEGYDVVCASRYMKQGKKLGGRFLQTLFSRWAGLSLCCLTGIPTHDASNAFKMYRKEALDSIEIKEAGFASSLEIVVKLFLKGYRITEIPTIWKDRVAGESSFNVWKVIRNYLRWYFWALFAKKDKAR
jgi:glycosyltransferase involved in cell wall biosynthesis